MKTLITLLLILTTIICNGQNISRDTIKITMLITNCDRCASRSLNGYAVRMQLPISKEWRIVEYLDYRKKPLPQKATVWQSIIHPIDSVKPATFLIY
jgi:hypothetical protein